MAPVVSQFARQLAHDVQQDDLAGITAAIARDGEVLWSRAFGWADRERQVPAARETIYKVGSISKTVTAALMATLVDEGMVSLSTPLEELVPEIGDIGDRPADANPALPMLRHVANHTSGLPDVPELPDASIGHVSIWKSKLLASIPTLRYRTRPGTEYHYSNVGYALLGLALDRAGNQDFVEQVRMRIFEPMGMTSSTYLIDANLRARLATGYYNRPGRPVNTEYPLRQHANSGYRVPGGGAYSTVDDLARLAAGVMGRGGRELFRPCRALGNAVRADARRWPHRSRLRHLPEGRGRPHLREPRGHGGRLQGLLHLRAGDGADGGPASQLQLGPDRPERDRPLAHLQLARGLRIPDSGPMTASLIPPAWLRLDRISIVRG